MTQEYTSMAAKKKTTKKAPEPTTVALTLVISPEGEELWDSIVEAVTNSIGALVTDEVTFTLNTALSYGADPVEAVEPDEEEEEDYGDDDDVEEEDEDEEDEDEEDEEEGEGYTRADLEEWTLRDLRAAAREAGYDREDVKGLDRDSLIDLLAIDGDEEEDEDVEEEDVEEDEDDEEYEELDEDDLAAMSVKELRDIAKEYEVKVPRGATKTDIIDLLMEADE
jgi:hypothetical protein